MHLECICSKYLSHFRVIQYSIDVELNIPVIITSNNKRSRIKKISLLIYQSFKLAHELFTNIYIISYCTIELLIKIKCIITYRVQTIKCKI